MILIQDLHHVMARARRFHAFGCGMFDRQLHGEDTSILPIARKGVFSCGSALQSHGFCYAFPCCVIQLSKSVFAKPSGPVLTMLVTLPGNRRGSSVNPGLQTPSPNPNLKQARGKAD